MISGSNPKKIYGYVNNMKISYSQKLLLLGTQYKLNYTDRGTLVNYINSSNLSKDEKMDLFGKIKGITVYNNGNIAY